MHLIWDLAQALSVKLGARVQNLAITIRDSSPKMKILSSFARPQVVPNLYEFLSSAENKRRYFEECW